LEEIKDQRKAQDTSEDENSEDLNRYYEHLESSLKRIHELVDSFKAQIRNPDQNTTTSSLGEAYIYTITVIKTQFRPQGINAKINFSFDENLQNIEIGISRLNLVHILYNFIKNSVENLLKHNIE
jgi:nitrogen fixation/metabolism regulation signal transduction histidine kinase